MRILPTIHAPYHAAQRWLAPRPAALLGPLGFGLGGAVALLALLGLGSWGGLGLCLGLLGALLPLVRGATPVLRPVAVGRSAAHSHRRWGSQPHRRSRSCVW